MLVVVVLWFESIRKVPCVSIVFMYAKEILGHQVLLVGGARAHRLNPAKLSPAGLCIDRSRHCEALLVAYQHFKPVDITCPKHESETKDNFRSHCTAAQLMALALKAASSQLTRPAVAQVVRRQLLEPVLRRDVSCQASTAKFFVGGNWKANGTKASVEQLVSELNAGSVPDNVDVVVAPPAIYLERVKNTISPVYQVSADFASCPSRSN